MAEISGYLALLMSAFLSATLLPGSSEVVLLGLLQSQTGQPHTLVAIATLGNVAGSVMNWGVGRYLTAFKDRAWFPIKEAALARAQAWFARFGIWSLLLSWVPIIGDPLTLVAGSMRVPFGRFLLFVTIAKALRYIGIFAAWTYFN